MERYDAIHLYRLQSVGEIRSANGEWGAPDVVANLNDIQNTIRFYVVNGSACVILHAPYLVLEI